MNHKRRSADGTAARTACARAVIRSGIDERTGEVVTSGGLAGRIGWCAALVSGMAGGLLASHWNAPDVAALAGGVDAAGRPLPAAAWMALRRLGWAARVPEGITVNDRIVRMAQEQAGRTLRSARWRHELTSAVLATWPADPLKPTKEEWEAVRGAMTGGNRLPPSVVKASTRQILRFAGAKGRLPTDLFELAGAPSAARPLLLLCACDRQQATIERSAADPGRVLLRLQLPVRPDPRSYRDWTWVACPLTLPPTVPAGAVLHLPAVYVANRKIRADIAFTHAVPAAHRDGHTVALGVDWGLNTLLSAGAARLNVDATITALGSGAWYRAAGVLAKQHRLRRQGEQLQAKASHYDRLIAGDERHPLNARRAILAEEIRQVSQRRCNLNDALARSAARWAADQAVAAGATVIYLEDLRSMEARGMGRNLNTRLSQTVRGKIATWLRHLAAEAGIAVVTVPARGTSRQCPRCLAPLRHTAAPDKRARQGWKWAVCPSPHCGWQGDRDQGAWQRIAARGLTHQHTTITGRSSRTMTIPAINGDLEAAAVVTPEPARPRPQPDRARRTSARPAPRRRRAPSPARPPGRTGQRPEGHVPTVRLLPRAAHRNQDVTTISTPARRHQPRGAALGAGFHLHAHATPPRWEPEPGQPPRLTQDHQADQRRYDHAHQTINLPAFLHLLPAPGRRTLDLACGEGRLGRVLQSLGHTVVGIDASPTLVRLAAAHHARAPAVLADAARLPFNDGSFDLAVAYMCLHDIDEMPGAVGEVARVLVPSGQLCLAIPHPMSSAGSFAGRSADAPFTITGSYLDPRPLQMTADRDNVHPTFHSEHRPLQAYAGALEAAGLLTATIREVTAPDQVASGDPAERRWQRIPLFLHLRAVKPA